MTTLLAPLGLAVVTTAQRDVLTGSDGMLVWNADSDRVERYGDGEWQPLALTDDVNEIIGTLAMEVGRLRTALRFLGLEPDQFDPDRY